MLPSTPFNLPFASNGVDVHVRAGSIAGYVVGLVLSLDGVTFTGIGAASMLVWEALGQPRVVNNTPGALLPIGGFFLGVGVVLAAVGIPLWLANHTQVDVSEHRIATLSGGSLATVYSGVAQIGVTNSTVFVGSYREVESFPLAGGMVSDGPMTLCESFASDTSAVYCDVGTGSNLRIGSDGASSTLGSVVNPVGSDPFPYIAYDDTYAYWVNNATAGTIMKAPKAGSGTATVLAQDTSPTAIAVDANSVYWSDEAGYIKSVPK